MPESRLWIVSGFLCLSVTLFLIWGLRAPYDFILSLRFTKLAALVLVGATTGAATVIFQTVAANRLVTPGIVGFDALFVFLQTTLIVGLGTSGFAGLPPLAKFLTETAVMVVFATCLFGFILRRGAGDLVRMILAGVVLGVLLRGLAGFAQRVVDPSEYAVIQQASVASFTAVDPAILSIAAILSGALLTYAWGTLARDLDVAALGRDKALSLGVSHDGLVLRALAVVAGLVAVSTALVGPVTFLGLLSASLAYALVPTAAHRMLIPAAAIIGAAILVAGQFLFERVFGLVSSLSIVVELAGGAVFLFLVLRKAQR